MMQKRVKLKLTFEADLDPSPGWGDKPEDWKNLVLKTLDINRHYNTKVTVDAVETYNSGKSFIVSYGQLTSSNTKKAGDVSGWYYVPVDPDGRPLIRPSVCFDSPMDAWKAAKAAYPDHKIYSVDEATWLMDQIVRMG